MDFYSTWPYFAGMAVILLLASTPLLSWADTPPKAVTNRFRSIDGLRGFLALAVVFHHGALYHQYLQTQRWYAPPTRFYNDLGSVGIAMFFMITGYLFWTQMLKAEGRPNLAKLYLGRIFRIVPLYVFLAFLVLVTVGVMTQWRLEQPPLALVKQVARWLAGGVVTGGAVNGYAGTVQIAAGVTWTLHYEWIFYASLMVTSFFARRFIWGALLPVMGLLVTAIMLHKDNLPLAATLMFCVGMTAASAKSMFAAKPIEISRWRQWALSTGIILCLSYVLLFCDDVFSARVILVLGVAFMLVAFGGTLFGLLLTRPAIRLGDVSYGIYLLQGPIFLVMFAPAWVRSFAIESAWLHWTIVIVTALALVMIATLTHVLIERPGIQAGQWIWLRTMSIRSRIATPGSHEIQRKPEPI